MKYSKWTTLLLLLPLTALWTETPVDRQVDAGTATEVSVDIISGSLLIREWNQPEVRVTGTLGADVEELEINTDQGEIEIDLKIPRNRSGKLEIDAVLEIWIPVEIRLSAETVSASIDAQEITGHLELSTVSGSISATGSAPSVELESVSGNLQFSGETSEVQAESVSGSVRLDGVSGSVEAQTVSGEVEVYAEIVHRVELEAVTGNLYFAGALDDQARLEASIHSGSVTMALPSDTLADFSVETFSGSIDNEFGPEAERTSDYGPGRRLDFSTGSGGASVQVESFSGPVVLKYQ